VARSQCAHARTGTDDLLEIAEGVFRFEWFDRVMDLLAANGDQRRPATMTASPPPWLAHAYPEMLPVRADGVVLSPGGCRRASSR
jgi:beta-galactosidase